MAAGRRWAAFPLFLPTLSVLLLVTPSITYGADSLTFGQYLFSNQTLVSKQGLFELGFFRPGSSTKLYLGIWYKNVVLRTYVWVANRDKPISESDANSAFLKISDDGSTFALFANTSSTSSIWSASPSVPTGNRSSGSNSTRVLLLDSGNLVLVDGDSLHPSAFLWESFDHPTDTFLPGSKIGYNHTAGKSWALTSWKSHDDPSPGSYTYQIDPSGAIQYFLLWRGNGQPYWSTGVYDGRVFPTVPEVTGMRPYLITFSDPSDTAAKYVSYFDQRPGRMSGMFVDTSGMLKWQHWLVETAEWQVFGKMPRDPCQVPSHCGVYGLCLSSTYPSCQCLPGFQPQSQAAWEAEDYTSGCVRKAPLACSTSGGDSDGFLPVQAVLGSPVGSDANSTALLNNISTRAECEEACLRNCLCTAYSFDTSGCRVWHGELMNVKQVQEGGGLSALRLRLSSSQLKAIASSAGSISNKKQHSNFVIGLLSGVLSLLLLSVVLAWYWCSRRRNYSKTGGADLGFLTLYNYEDLQKATRNFSSVIGKGGFGSVYRGTLPDDSPIAVKKLTYGPTSGHGEKQFRSEVRAMATIQHINILQLRGFCSQGPHRILVYDYMPNRSLDAYLFPKAAVRMPWAHGYNVALGVAHGLAYLHDKCLDRIVHCDIKPENILLDADMCPKVADFGMAKLIGRDFSRALTTMRGTVGYLAPEWISGLPITPKADVYSYGMMLFEIVLGRRNREPPTMQRQSNGEVLDGFSDSGGCQGWFFPIWAATHIAGGPGSDLADDLLKECQSSKADHGHRVEEFRRAWRVAWWCVQDREEHRPTMAQVVQMLEGVLDLGAPPIPRHLRSQVENEDAVMGNLSLSQIWQSLMTPTLSLVGNT